MLRAFFAGMGAATAAFVGFVATFAGGVIILNRAKGRILSRAARFGVTP